MKYDVVTIGDAMKDIFVFPSIDEMKKPIAGKVLGPDEKNEKFLVLGYGDKLTISDTCEGVGGTAANVAVGLAKLGLKTGIISACGKDDFGQEVLTSLKESEVDTKLIKVYNSKRTSFSIIISYKGERSILVYHSFLPTNFEISENLETDWLYIGPLGEDYRHLYAKITGLAAEKNLKIALNPGSVQLKDGLAAFGGLLRVIKILFLNKEEARKLTGMNNFATVKQMAKELQKSGPKTVVITDGPEGAYVLEGSEFLKIGPYPGHRVESTGAGDSFASGFLAAHIAEKELLECLKWGVINSASVVGKYGAQQGLLSASVIKKKIKEYHFPADSLRFS